MSIYGSVLNSCIYISLYPCFETISFEVGHLYLFKLGIRIFRQELGWLAINQIVKITEHFLPFIVLAANFRRLCYIKWMQLDYHADCRGVKTYFRIHQRSVIKKSFKKFFMNFWNQAFSAIWFEKELWQKSIYNRPDALTISKYLKDDSFALHFFNIGYTLQKLNYVLSIASAVD